VCHVLLQQEIRDEGDQVLYTAAQRGMEEVVQMLLDVTTFASSSISQRMEASLCGAASCARVGLVQSLLSSLQRKVQSGVVTDTFCKATINTAMEAALTGAQYSHRSYLPHPQQGSPSSHHPPVPSDRKPLVRLLLDSGAEADHQGGRPLRLAAQHCGWGVVKVLLDKGAVEVGQALVGAAARGDPHLITQLRSLLPQGGAAQDPAVLVAAAEHQHASIVQQLVSVGYSASAALRTAATTGNVSAAVTLLTTDGVPVPQGGGVMKKLRRLAKRTQSEELMDALNM
jgi:hypothetical protein